jgi:hypothetical protein
MFKLTADDLNKNILGVGDGPASANAELTKQGGQIISIDPIYQFTTDNIRQRLKETYTTVVEQMLISAHNYNWTTFRDADDLGQHRMASMTLFLDDFDTGLTEGRYQHQQLPTLSFADQSFELALVSHLLFLYSAHLSEEFHLQSIRELLRVATEVRIFRLLTLAGDLSPYLSTVEQQLLTWGYESERVTVAYEFQKGGNQMMRIRSVIP